MLHLYQLLYILNIEHIFSDYNANAGFMKSLMSCRNRQHWPEVTAAHQERERQREREREREMGVLGSGGNRRAQQHKWQWTVASHLSGNLIGRNVYVWHIYIDNREGSLQPTLLSLLHKPKSSKWNFSFILKLGASTHLSIKLWPTRNPKASNFEIHWSW